MSKILNLDFAETNSFKIEFLNPKAKKTFVYL